MGKGYGEGPAAEERYEALERGEGSVGGTAPRDRHAVYGSTDDEPEKHFLGWVGDVDPDELFRSGRAWGITVLRRPG
jgi:hypothetical protein